MQQNKDNIGVKSVIQVDNELLENISYLLEVKADKSLLNIFTDLHPADIAEILNHLKPEDAEAAFSILDTETAGEVLTELDENLRERILKNIDKEKITDIVDELETDDATDIVSELPEQVAEHVLENIDKEDSEDVKELLKYPEDSAGGIMTSDFVFVHESATVKDAIKEVRKHADEFEQIYHIYVLNDEGQLVGIVQLKSLLIYPLHKRIKSIMEKDLIYVTPEVDQEEVAAIMEKYDLVAIPVVDENRKMLGRITFDDIVDVIQEEASEDIQKMAGLTEEEELSYSTFRVSRNRLPWLFVSLFGEMISAVVLSSFQASIQEIIVASFFIPIVMAMGGSAGNQAAIVMVQAMSSGSLWVKESLARLWKEFRVALLNGIISAIVLLGLTYYLFDVSLNFAMILSLSLFVIMVNATMIGAVVPIVLKKLGADPVIATGPFVATSNDIIGLLIYLSLITILYAPV